MKRFENRQRIVVINHALLDGKAGRVVRLRMQDDGAWVRMDEVPPLELRHFPDGDSRQYEVLLSPEWCEPERLIVTKWVVGREGA